MSELSYRKINKIMNRVVDPDLLKMDTDPAF
jgi:hypothetical protein